MGAGLLTHGGRARGVGGTMPPSGIAAWGKDARPQIQHRSHGKIR
jgi:hypothetical protein